MKISSNILIFLGSFGFGSIEWVQDIYGMIVGNGELIVNFSGALISTIIIAGWKEYLKQRRENATVECEKCNKKVLK